DVGLRWSTSLADRFGLAFFVGNSFERLAAESPSQYRADFGGPEVIVDVELDGVNLIKETLLKARVFEHLAVECSLFFVHDPLDRRIAGHERCVGNIETRRLRWRCRRGLVRLLPTSSASAATTTSTTILVLCV